MPFYVGITKNPKARISGHRKKFGSSVHLEVVQRFSDRCRAEAAERKMINELVAENVLLENMSINPQKKSTRTILVSIFLTPEEVDAWGGRDAAREAGIKYLRNKDKYIL